MIIKIDNIKETILDGSYTDGSNFLNRVFPNKKTEFLSSQFNPSVKIGSPSSLFFKALHTAYANHHAFGIRPESLMYLITSVVAETVKRHPEHYRHLFTESKGKTGITVRHDGLRRGDPFSPWDEAIPMFDTALRSLIPGDLMDHFLPEFSTATPTTAIASLISFMDAASPYFDYRVFTKCGIPRILLLGEVEDYRKLLDSARNLAVNFKLHLADYFADLCPILEELLETIESGVAKQEFWEGIYKGRNMSGGYTYSGWMGKFLHYIHKVEAGEKHLVVKSSHYIISGSEPSHVSSVPFIWDYLGQEIPMLFTGGFLGVSSVGEALTPCLGYGVLEA